MSDAQTYEPLAPDALLARVRELCDQGWRLVQLGATPLGELVEVNYSFDRDGRFLNLRLTLAAAAARVPSITPVYWCAFAYENEMHDLFRVRVEGIAVDYKGKFYKTTVPFPFGARGLAAAAATLATAKPVAAPTTPPAGPAA